MARTEKASQMYRKKTLNVNDDLNIKYDDDDIENVDAYWSTAVSVIGNQTLDFMDDTVISEQSDTLFDLKNIRQSVRSGDREINAASYLYKKTIDNTMKQDALTKGEPGKIISKKRLTLKAEGNDSDEVIDISNLEEKENVNTNTHQPSKEEVKEDEWFPESDKVEPDSGPAECENEQTSESHSQPPFDELENFENDAPKTNDSSTGTDSNPRHMNNTAEDTRVFMDFRPKRTQKNSHSIVVQDVKSVATLNKIRPVVCTEKINTAIMELDYLAYIDNENSDKAFSVFIIKGKIEIEIENKKNIMKKGEATVIEEGDVYSMNCLSRNGATLFLSYAL